MEGATNKKQLECEQCGLKWADEELDAHYVCPDCGGNVEEPRPQRELNPNDPSEAWRIATAIVRATP